MGLLIWARRRIISNNSSIKILFQIAVNIHNESILYCLLQLCTNCSVNRTTQFIVQRMLQNLTVKQRIQHHRTPRYSEQMKRPQAVQSAKNTPSPQKGFAELLILIFSINRHSLSDAAKTDVYNENPFESVLFIQDKFSTASANED